MPGHHPQPRPHAPPHPHRRPVRMGHGGLAAGEAERADPDAATEPAASRRRAAHGAAAGDAPGHPAGRHIRLRWQHGLRHVATGGRGRCHGGHGYPLESRWQRLDLRPPRVLRRPGPPGAAVPPGPAQRARSGRLRRDRREPGPDPGVQRVAGLVAGARRRPRAGAAGCTGRMAGLTGAQGTQGPGALARHHGGRAGEHARRALRRFDQSLAALPDPRVPAVGAGRLLPGGRRLGLSRPVAGRHGPDCPRPRAAGAADPHPCATAVRGRRCAALVA